MKSQELEKGGVDLLEYLQIVWRRKWLVLFVAAWVFGIALWRTYRTEPLYQASVTIQLNSSGGPAIFDRLGPILAQSRGIESEMEILKSRVIGERTAMSLQRHYALNPLRPGVSLKLSDVTVTDKTLPGVYVVTFVDDAGQYQVKDPGGNVVGVGRPGQPFEAGGLSFTLSKVSARSGSSLEIVIPKLAAIANALRSTLTVGVIRGTDIVNLGVRGNDPREAARTANAFAETYVDFTRQQKIQQLLSIRQFLEKQLDVFRQDLLKTGRGLADMGSLENKEAEAVLSRLRRTELGTGNQQYPVAGDVRYDLARSLVDLEMKRSLLQFTYTPNHRVIVELDREIAQVRNRLAKALQVDKEDNMPLIDLLQQSQAKLSMYNYMLQRQQETRLAEASELGSARIIDLAVPPEVPFSPNVSRNMKVGGMFGLSLGIGLALLLGRLDRTVKDVKDMEDRVGLPVFGAIPEISRRGFRMKSIGIDGRVSVDPLNLMLELPPGTVAAEAYRALRTNIQFASPGVSVRCFLFTSAGPAEGKSLTVANLAIALSQMEGRVLVIDADLRKPAQHKLFGVEAEVGLTDVLARNVPWREATIEGPVKNLDLIPAGKVPPNPAELLGGAVMRAFLTEVQQHYDLVLLDSPPTLIVADACVLAQLVEGVFLVVRAGVTTPEAIARVQSTLSTVNAKLIGTILNAIPSSNGIGPYGLGRYHYGYHNYHYVEDQSEKGGRLKQTAEHILTEGRRLFKRYL